MSTMNLLLLLNWTWAFITLLHSNNGTVGAPVVYVPEEHFLVLQCRPGSDVQWSHGVTRVNASKHNSRNSRRYQTKHQQLSDGSLLIKDLEEMDSGLYYCNRRLVAEVIILSGDSYVVSEGSSLYLPCVFTDKFKQRWVYKHSSASRREGISTLFKNGTVRWEREDQDRRFIHDYHHLLITNLHISDSGIYLCNKEHVASVLVLHTAAETETYLTTPTGSREGASDKPDTTENMTLVIFLSFTVLAVVVVTLLSVSLCLKFGSRQKADRQEDTELQTTSSRAQSDPDWSFSEDHRLPFSDHSEIQYASLGRQNWRVQNWTKDKKQQVIYSTLLLNPTSPPPNTAKTHRH